MYLNCQPQHAVALLCTRSIFFKWRDAFHLKWKDLSNFRRIIAFWPGIPRSLQEFLWFLRKGILLPCRCKRSFAHLSQLFAFFVQQKGFYYTGKTELFFKMNWKCQNEWNGIRIWSSKVENNRIGKKKFTMIFSSWNWLISFINSFFIK